MVKHSTKGMIHLLDMYVNTVEINRTLALYVDMEIPILSVMECRLSMWRYAIWTEIVGWDWVD
jgi:hypothetical protein